MSPSAVQESDRSSALQRGTREFAGLYERNAYLVYNLALRITVDGRAAIEAAGAAFLASMSAPDGESQLIRLTVSRAVPNARATATLEAAGDAHAQGLLEATTPLSAPERAALALTSLAEADPAAVGAVLDIDADAAERLIARAWSAFAAATESPLERARAAQAGWLWAEPPGELWELLYPSFYAQLVRRLNAAEERDDAGTAVFAAVAAAAPAPSRKQRRRARRVEREARRERSPGRLRPLVLITAALAAGGVVAYTVGAFGSSHRGSAQRLVLAGPAKKLTPQQLRRLRAQERAAEAAYLAQQRRAARQARLQRALELQALRQQHDQQAAAARAAARAAAERRQAALKRAKQLAAQQQALQAQLIAQQQQQAHGTPATTSTPPTRTSSGSTNPNGHRHRSGSSSPTPTQAQQQCLYNANDGTYVCPQQ